MTLTRLTLTTVATATAVALTACGTVPGAVATPAATHTISTPALAPTPSSTPGTYYVSFTLDKVVGFYVSMKTQTALVSILGQDGIVIPPYAGGGQYDKSPGLGLTR
jgi:hypothetical protein